jgi:hypothetical protein
MTLKALSPVVCILLFGLFFWGVMCIPDAWIYPLIDFIGRAFVRVDLLCLILGAANLVRRFFVIFR